ncbi:hypothetical protein ACPWUF_06390 [Bisgaard Taxon 46]
MAYKTGNVTNFNALLSVIAEVAQKVGWVIDLQNTDELKLHNDELTCLFLKQNNNVFTYIDEKGSESGVHTRSLGLNQRYLSYDLFCTSQYIHAVVQLENQVFVHFGVGILQKDFQFNGGQYAFGTNAEDGTNYNSQAYGMSATSEKQNGPVVKIQNLDGIETTFFKSTDNYHVPGESFLSLGRWMMRENAWSFHPENNLVEYSQSKFGNLLIPCANSIYLYRKNKLYTRIGIVPDRYECTVHEIVPRTILTIAGEKWMIFPSLKYYKDLSKGSGAQGVAYRVID